jgi:hypothetical protein
VAEEGICGIQYIPKSAANCYNNDGTIDEFRGAFTVDSYLFEFLDSFSHGLVLSITFAKVVNIYEL